MGMQQGLVTVTGNLGADPVSFGKNIDAPACSFRVGVTPRYYDSRINQWRDRDTTWVGVRAYRTLASNILNSLHKGDPVIVSGTLHTERWVKEGVDRITPVIDANAVGHDLSQGVGRFRRAGREQPAAGEQGDANVANGMNGQMGAGAPANPSLPPNPNGAPGAVGNSTPSGAGRDPFAGGNGAPVELDVADGEEASVDPNTGEVYGAPGTDAGVAGAEADGGEATIPDASAPNASMLRDSAQDAPADEFSAPEDFADTNV